MGQESSKVLKRAFFHYLSENYLHFRNNHEKKHFQHYFFFHSNVSIKQLHCEIHTGATIYEQWNNKIKKSQMYAEKNPLLKNRKHEWMVSASDYFIGGWRQACPNLNFFEHFLEFLWILQKLIDNSIWDDWF